MNTDTRLYGSSKVGFLAVHLSGSGAQANDLKPLDIEYSVAVKAIQSMNVQDLLSIVGVVSGAGLLAPSPKPPSPPAIIGYYGGGLLSGLEQLPNSITFTANVTSAPALNNAAPPPAANNPPPAPPANNPTGATPSATTCVVSSAKGSNNSCSFSQQYQNEGLHNWDVSIGVPLTTLKKPNYSSVDGIVTANSVSTINAYGFFDIYPVPTDLISPPWLDYPHIALGLPFTGAVLDKPFFGGAGILNVRQIPKLGSFLSKILPVNFDFYGGVVWDKEPTPKTLAVGSSATQGALAENLNGHRVWKGQFGIEFSLRDVKQKLTSSSSKKSSS